MKKFKDIVNELLDLLDRETQFLSGYDQYHPRIKKILSYKKDKYKRKIIIQSSLEKIEKNPWWLVPILEHMVPKNKQPHIPEKDLGVISKTNKIWIRWGKEHNYIK